MFNPEVKVCLDVQQIKVKPEGKEEKDRVGKATSARLARNSQVTITLEDLAIATSNYYAFVPSSFYNQKRRETHFEQQQLFELDFDSKSEETRITPVQVLQRAREFELGFGFSYYSLSSTPEIPKFRMGFFLTEPVTDYGKAHKIIEMLMIIFPEADKACSDCTHFYFGGKERIFADEPKVPMNLGMLISASESIQASQITDKKNKGRKVKALAKDAKEVEAFLDSLEDNQSNLPSPSIIKNVDIDQELLPKLLILQSVASGMVRETPGYNQGERLHYHHIFNLVNNLRFIKGGPGWLEKQMDLNGEYLDYHYELVSRYKVDQMNAKYKYPTTLSKFSPFVEDHEYHNVLDATGRGEYNVVETPGYKASALSLRSAENMFDKAVKEFIEAKDNKVHVFKIITGLGKTRALIQLLHRLIDQGLGGYTIAFATHLLKNEFCRDVGIPNAEEYFGTPRGDRKRTNVYVTPELPSRLPKHYKEKLEYFQANGVHTHFKKTLNDYKEVLQNAGDSISDEERLALEQLEIYFAANEAAYGCTWQNIITTHAKALVKDEKDNYPFGHNNTLIFDESPLLTAMITTDRVCREDLKRLSESTNNKTIKEICQHYIDFINDGAPKFTEMEEWMWGSAFKEMVDIVVEGQRTKKFTSNLLGFFSSAKIYGKLIENDDEETSEEDGKKKKSFYPGELQFVTRTDLPEDRKIGIFAADADEEIYRLVFGDDRLVFINISNVVCQGKFEQDTSHSYSKSSLLSKRKPSQADSTTTQSKSLQIALEEAKNYDYVLTHKSLKHLFPNAHPYIHHGNASGYNELEGKKILVLSTPHVPEFVYWLFAKVIGVKHDARDNFGLIRRRITRNGYSFSFPTFERDVMSHIQCFFIERQLIQTVGRARLLREAKAEVKVLSDYPLRYFWVGDPAVNVEEYEVLTESIVEEDCSYIYF